jgi:hypothetical protein
MSKYEVQQLTTCEGWTNTWHEYDDDNWEIPMLFDTFEEALDELDSFLNDCDKEYQRGNIDSPYLRDEFRIVKV